jgi:hypothetical protein
VDTNAPLSATERSSRKKFNKELAELNFTFGQECWNMPVVPDTQEAKKRRITVRG